MLKHEMDARPGGGERARRRWPTGANSTFEALYFEVTPDRRLIYIDRMKLDDRKISVSLATLQIAPAGAGSQPTLTEQGAFLDGYDDAGLRERGAGFCSAGWTPRLRRESFCCSRGGAKMFRNSTPEARIVGR